MCEGFFFGTIHVLFLVLGGTEYTKGCTVKGTRTRTGYRKSVSAPGEYEHALRNGGDKIIH